MAWCPYSWIRRRNQNSSSASITLLTFLVKNFFACLSRLLSLYDPCRSCRWASRALEDFLYTEHNQRFGSRAVKCVRQKNALNANPEANAHKKSIKLFLVFVVVAPSRSRCYQMHKMGIANKQILRRSEIVKHGEWSIKHAKFPPIDYKTSCMGYGLLAGLDWGLLIFMMIFDSKKETTKFFMPSQKRENIGKSINKFFTLDGSPNMAKWMLEQIFLLRHF